MRIANHEKDCERHQIRTLGKFYKCLRPGCWFKTVVWNYFRYHVFETKQCHDFYMANGGYSNIYWTNVSEVRVRPKTADPRECIPVGTRSNVEDVEDDDVLVKRPGPGPGPK